MSFDLLLLVYAAIGNYYQLSFYPSHDYTKRFEKCFLYTFGSTLF